MNIEVFWNILFAWIIITLGIVAFIGAATSLSSRYSNKSDSEESE